MKKELYVEFEPDDYLLELLHAAPVEVAPVEGIEVEGIEVEGIEVAPSAAEGGNLGGELKDD